MCIRDRCAGCIVRWWQQEPWYARGQWERYGALLRGAVLAVLGAIGLTNLYNLACGGAPIFKVFFYPLYSSNYMEMCIRDRCMDTAREKQLLEKLLATGNAPWKKWED